MNERIAEFATMCDAHDFMKLKNREVGDDAYTVCAGVHMMYAVMPRIRYASNLGNGESPPESHYFDNEEDDDE